MIPLKSWQTANKGQRKLRPDCQYRRIGPRCDFWRLTTNFTVLYACPFLLPGRFWPARGSSRNLPLAFIPKMKILAMNSQNSVIRARAEPGT